MDQYYHSNPYYERLSTREGSLMEEKKLQLYLGFLGLKMGFLEEWFEDVPELSNYFHESFEKIDKVLWRNRDSIWKKDDFKKGADKRMREIYESLRKKFPSPTLSNSIIDREYLFLTSRESLKKLDDLYFM